MTETHIYPQRWYNTIQGHFLRILASGLLPASWFRPPIPDDNARPPSQEFPSVEIVTHCWQYARTLTYQLSSFVNYPPTKLDLTVTVFYATSDTATVRLLEFIGQHDVPNVTWNWQPLPEGELFRRGIGRNRAALASQADWVWMTDCDIIFHKGCLDSLSESLLGRNDVLLYPRTDRTTPLLAESNPVLEKGKQLELVDIDTTDFNVCTRDRARGEYQIIHGDVARAIGYCAGLSLYQTPATHFCKCYEDRAFRWLVGTQGTPIDIEGVYQIRHAEKGRYHKGTAWSRLRGKIRQLQG